MTFTTETPESPGFYLSSDVIAPLGEAVGAQARLGMMDWTPTLMSETNRLYNAQRGAIDPNQGVGRGPPRRLAPTSPALSLPDAQAQAKAAGVESLPLYDGVRQETLDIMVERQQAKQALQRTIARASSDSGTRAALALTSLAVGIADPVNIATAFVPIVPEVKYAGWLAKAGESFLARTAVRAGTGAIEGGVGAAALEPVTAALHSSVGDDYTLTDSLINIGFGSLAGAGLRALGGAAKDAAGRFLPTRSPVEDLPADAQRRVMIAALGQMSEGRAVDPSAQIALEREAQGAPTADTVNAPAEPARAAIDQAVDSATKPSALADQPFAEQAAGAGEPSAAPKAMESAAARETPTVSDAVPLDAAGAEAEANDAIAELDRTEQAVGLKPEDRAESGGADIAAADEAIKLADNDRKLYDRAAVCLAGNG
jgi:hypothetical protein